MTQVLSDTFTDTNGDPWDATKWVTANTGGGGTKTTSIQGNRGRLAIVSANNNAYIIQEAQITDVADVEVTGLVVLSLTSGTSAGWHVAVRADADWTHPNTSVPGSGYRLSQAGTTNTCNLLRRDPTNGQDILDTFTGPTRTNDVRFRFQVIGSDIKAKVWAASGSEPGAWDLEASNSDVTAAGRVLLSMQGGLNSSTLHYDWDDIAIESFDETPLPTSGSGWGIPVGI